MAKSICDKFDLLEARLKVAEIKINMLAVSCDMVGYCECKGIKQKATVDEGMPVCVTCGHIIKKLLVHVKI